MYRTYGLSTRLYVQNCVNHHYTLSPINVFRPLSTKCRFDWLKRLDPLQFLQGNYAESSFVDIDTETITSCRDSVISAINNYDNVITKLKDTTSMIEHEIYESLRSVKPLKTIFGRYIFTANSLPNGHTHYFRQKGSFKQLLFDTSAVASKYSKYDYCVVKNMKYSPKLDLLCAICDIHGNDHNILFVKSLKTHKHVETVTNIVNAEFLDTPDKCFIFYTRSIDKVMQLRRIVYYQNKLVSDNLIYSETDPTQTLGIYKTRDSKMIFITTNTSSRAKFLYIIKLNCQRSPKLLKLSLDGVYDKLFLEHRHNHVIALTKCNSKYKLMALSVVRKCNQIVTSWPLDNGINILGLEVFNKGIVLHGIQNPSVPVIGVINNVKELPQLKPLIDCGVITPDANPDFNSDIFHFTLENPAISYVPSFMILTNSNTHISDYPTKYKFIPYTFTSYDGTTVHISTIYLRESDKGIVYFYGFSKQLLKLHSEYEHNTLLKCGYKLCYIHSRSHDPAVALMDIVYGINYLIHNRIINQNNLRLVTESAGSSLVDELLLAFKDFNITFILKSPHLPVANNDSLNTISPTGNTYKRIFLMNVGGFDEKTPWWESFAYITKKSICKDCNIATFLDFHEHGGHNNGSTFVKQISHAARTAAILLNF
ncbi:hypothetical protein BMR1_01G00280 [Babesia microti strain RI]|uniref:Peptidase S9A N-terminal domain-containing protein n=1 Tax=Babesia microti (strain RI) TaxID=1133968 RepID=A0A1N6LWA0_BABMR|nr:hypothetical protein BMR1_01G00280 [Babesia microti strain RI]SIO73152.1 hypothetical protein BMR1_01G00280 [Babesia microti strain RI]|eukprot:XP_021337263.1 hypothetical protein BMR1_01G00280 [Babesia microti strain RI]